MTKTSKKGPAFLLKTYDMLDKQEFKQIIDWNQDGNGFVVKNSDELSLQVLPKYFKHSNMHSFIRQLNMYGFNKKRGGKTQNYYFHAMFQKGKRDLIFEMQRKVQKKGIHKQDKKQGALESASILVEQSHLNQQNKVQNNRRNNCQIEEMDIFKKILQLANVNRTLILEQMYHLAHLEKTNILRSSLDQALPHQKPQNQVINQDYETLERFKKAKQTYINDQSLIWDKIFQVLKVFQTQTMIRSEKSSKQTQLQIPKNLQIHKGQENVQNQQIRSNQLNEKINHLHKNIDGMFSLINNE